MNSPRTRPQRRSELFYGSLLMMLILGSTAAFAGVSGPVVRLFPTTVLEDIRETGQVAEDMDRAEQLRRVGSPRLVVTLSTLRPETRKPVTCVCVWIWMPMRSQARAKPQTTASWRMIPPGGWYRAAMIGYLGCSLQSM